MLNLSLQKLMLVVGKKAFAAIFVNFRCLDCLNSTLCSHAQVNQVGVETVFTAGIFR